jgi:hypothetical protein
MAARLRARVQPNGVEITCVDKRLLGERLVPWPDWWRAGADVTAVRAIVSLVDDGGAQVAGASVFVPSEAAVALPSGVASPSSSTVVSKVRRGGCGCGGAAATGDRSSRCNAAS